MWIRQICVVVLVVSTSGCASDSTTSPRDTGAAPAATTIAPTSTTPATSAPPATPTTATPPANPATTLADPVVARWAEDMQYLADAIRRVHPNPFWRQSEAEFDASLQAAPEHLATLGDSDARAEVMRLMAGIDGHSGVYLGEAGFHLYAIYLYNFGDTMNVIASPDPALFGSTALSINGTPIADAIAAVEPYSPFDNASTVKLLVPTLLATPEVLHAAGVIDDVTTPNILLRLTDGTERTLNPEQLSWEEYVAIDPKPVGMTKIASIPMLARIDEPFRTTVLDYTSPADGRVLYLQYNEVVAQSGATSIRQLALEIETALDGGDISRVVVDVRFNAGGNNLTYPQLLKVLTTHPALASPGSVVVLNSRQTFSAAVLFGTELAQRTNVVFVGESTGGSPNTYANPRPVKLPNSGIVVQVSSKYFEIGGPDDRRDSISPDIAVDLQLDDLLAGRDPVLNAALAPALGG
jgi:hypothetical protein